MEIVQTMNSDPGLAIGKSVNLLLPLCGVSFCLSFSDPTPLYPTFSPFYVKMSQKKSMKVKYLTLSLSLSLPQPDPHQATQPLTG